MTDKINVKIPRGRPRQWWIDTVKTHIGKYVPGLSLEESEDRERCREIVEEAKTLHWL